MKSKLVVRIACWWLSRAHLWCLLYSCVKFLRLAQEPIEETIRIIDLLLDGERDEHSEPGEHGDCNRNRNVAIMPDMVGTNMNRCQICGALVPQLTDALKHDEKVASHGQPKACSISIRNSLMFLNPSMSDVTFVVGETEKEQLPSHKYVLATGSEVFHRMFYGSLPESNVVEVPDCTPFAFKTMLKFMYCDEIEMDCDKVSECLYAAEKYEVTAVQDAAVRLMETHLNASNACLFLSNAILYRNEDLAAKCWKVIEEQTTAALASEDFKQIDRSTLKLIARRQKLSCREIELYSACSNWAKAECVRRGEEETPTNQRLMLGDCLKYMRFSLMTVPDVIDVLVGEKILRNEEILKILLHIIASQRSSLPTPKINFIMEDEPILPSLPD